MDKYLLGIIITGVLLSSALYIIPIQDAESLLAIPPQRAFSLIFGPGGLNITAPFSQSNFTISGGDVEFFPDNFTINLGPNATALFDQLNSTVFSLNGSIPVLIEGDQIDLTAIGNLTEISLEDCLQDQMLFYDSGVWTCIDSSTLNGTGGTGNLTQTLTDVYFNAEEGTVDDLTGVDCVNNITYNFFDNTNPHEYARQAIEFCGSGDIDDNVTWLYVVPQLYNASAPVDFDFRLFWTNDIGGGGSFIQTTTNDCEESIGPVGPAGDVTCGSTDIEMHAENVVETPADDNDLSAYRFTGVTVPNAATIVNASIQFHADETDPNVPIVVVFHGEDVDDSATLTSANFNISGRTNTTASVSWSIPEWDTIHEEGPDQVTPDLSTIVQEIVDRPGWVSGNDMTIMLNDWIDNTGVNDGLRHAESANGEASNAPELTIFFTTGALMPVCFEFSLITLTNSNNMDGDFIAFETVCTNRGGIDQLSITEFIIEEIDHVFADGDLVFFKIVRPDDFVVNDFEGDVFLFGAELKWRN